MSSFLPLEILCPNWVFSHISNVHVCKNRGWFKEGTYTAFASRALVEMGEGTYVGARATVMFLEVLGVGTVILPTPRVPGCSEHEELLLNDVLFIPDALCNFIGGTTDLAGKFDIIAGTRSLVDEQGRCLAYFEMIEAMLHIQLSGPPVGPVVGPSVFDRQYNAYILRVFWDQGERRRWVTDGKTLQDQASHTEEFSTVQPIGNAAEHAIFRTGFNATGYSTAPSMDNAAQNLESNVALSTQQYAAARTMGNATQHPCDNIGFPTPEHSATFSMGDAFQIPELTEQLTVNVPEELPVLMSTSRLLHPAGHHTEYNEEEYGFLARFWGGEYNFLRAHGLNVFDVAQCEVGRRILRSYVEENSGEGKFFG